MSNNIVIEKARVNQFDFVVYASTAESVLDSLDAIQAELNGIDEAVVLFDNLLYAGNSIDRFIQAKISGGSFDVDSFEFVEQEKKNDVREMANDFFCRNADIIHSSGILNSVQRMLILKGIAI